MHRPTLAPEVEQRVADHLRSAITWDRTCIWCNRSQHAHRSKNTTSM